MATQARLACYQLLTDDDWEQNEAPKGLTRPDLLLEKRPSFSGHETLNLFESKGSNGPNLWWPDDRGWCLATEIDLDSTLVGGSAELIKGLLSDSDIEAVPARLEDSVAINADTMNE